MSTAPARAFEVRHLQLARAVFAAIAAGMITFSPDHSASVGLAVFSGFGLATGLVLLLSAWVVSPAGARAVPALLGALAVVAGMAAGVTALRSTALFFVVVIAWALLSGLVETTAGARGMRRRGDLAERSEARDALVVGIATLVLGVVLLFVPATYALPYYIEDAGQSFTLTGITIAVGAFGAYAAIVAVYLAIAGLSPRRAAETTEAATAAPEKGTPA